MNWGLMHKYYCPVSRRQPSDAGPCQMDPEQRHNRGREGNSDGQVPEWRADLSYKNPCWNSGKRNKKYILKVSTAPSFKGHRFCISLAAGRSANRYLSRVHRWGMVSVAGLVPRREERSWVNDTLFCREFHFTGACVKRTLIWMRIDISPAKQGN